ncbi:hypothetical protein SSX86_000020 [Deinandra increscens subsp. villosa]|uniref:Terpene synthase N-terminal domain-containing protein n=1 Tax=Deinandra increscens subsp. villosa TaxID=3103831 RepID=A0AAP0HA92_9ASTR
MDWTPLRHVTSMALPISALPFQESAATRRIDQSPLLREPPSPFSSPEQFAKHHPPSSLERQAYGKAMEQPKEQVRRLILGSTIDSNEKLSLIYYVYRLGLTYLFSKDNIDAQLDTLFNLQEDYNQTDLYTTSLHFQIFRIFGYRFSCDVFKDFSTSEFKETISKDVRGMISLYESAQLRIREESILDEAMAFTETKLKT